MIGITVILTLVVSASVQAEDENGPTILTAKENSVVFLTMENADKLLRENRVLVLMAYVPWDRIYRAKIGDYEKVAEAVLKNTNDMQLGKLDLSTDPDVAELFEIKGHSLQYFLFFKGKIYNIPAMTDGKSFLKKIQAMSNKDWKPNEVAPKLTNRLKTIERSDFGNGKLEKRPFAVIIFRAEGSPAADRLQYDYDMAVNSLKDVPKPFRFYVFDATNTPNTNEKYGVTSLPKFLIFRHGKHYEWNGPYVGSKAIAKHIQEHMKPTLTEIPNPQIFDEYMKNNTKRATVVGFFESTTIPKFSDYLEAAYRLRDRFNFVVMSTPYVRNNGGEEMQAPGWTLAVMLPKRDHTPDDQTNAVLNQQDASLEAIIDFVRWKGTPLAGERTPENENVVYTLRPLVVVYGKVDWSKAGRKETEYLRDKVASAAKEHKDTLFCIADREKYAQEIQRFGFNMDPKYDLHVGIIGKDGEYYARWETTHMNSKMIGEFVGQFKAGEIKPFYRSKEAKNPTNKVVTQLTGVTFQSEIVEGTSFKYAAILFYHQTARYWRAAEESFKDFARDDLWKKKEIKFYQIDLSENDIPATFNITTYPTMGLLHVTDKKNMLRYEGQRYEIWNAKNTLKALYKTLKKTVEKVDQTENVVKNTEL